MSDLSPPDAATLHAAARSRSGTAPKNDGADFGFWDLVDIVNPLQHIPVVSSAYRRITGDDIRPDTQILGDTLYGGPIGMAVSAANAIVAQVTGRTAGDHLVAMLAGDATDATPDGGATAAVATAGGGTATGLAGAQPGPVPGVGEPASAAAPADGDAAVTVVAAPRTAVLPHGFPLAPPTRTLVGGMPPTRPAMPPAAPAARGTLTIGTDLDARLRQLAAAGKPAGTASAPAPGDEQPALPDAAAAPPPPHPQAVPVADVPAAMMRALDLYQRSATGAAAPAAVVPGLDTRS